MRRDKNIVRRTVTIVAVTSAALFASPHASAQDWPSRLVRIVVDADHVPDVLQVVGAAAQGVGDPLLRGVHSVAASRVKVVARDEVGGQGAPDRREHHREHDPALQGL